MCAAVKGCNWYKKYCFSFYNKDDGDDNGFNNNNAYIIEQNPWEGHRFSVSQEILRIDGVRRFITVCARARLLSLFVARLFSLRRTVLFF
jgi:hypothetical protein